MNYLKMLGLATAIATALMLFTGAAYASPLTSPEGTSYTSTIKAESEGSTSLEGAFVTVTCQKSATEGKVESHSSTGAEGKLASLSFGECNYSVNVVNPGSLKIHTGETKPGTVTSSGAEIKVSTSVGECIFTTSGTHIGTLTDTNTTGGAATLDLNGAKIPRTGGNFLCGSSGTWTGSYKVTTPSTLYIHGAPVPPPSPLTSPEGTSYTSTIKAESEGALALEGAFVTVSCNKSTLESKVESHTTTTANGKVSGLTFAECNYPMSVNKIGSLEIHSTGAGTATVTSSGVEISIATSVGTCIFTTTNTDIGTITDSSLTKGNATLDIGSRPIPRTGGNFLCGSSGTLTGNYKITTPSTLYVD